MSFILHGTEINSIRHLEFVSPRRKFTRRFCQAFAKHTENISMCCNRKDGCWKLKIIILLIIRVKAQD